MILNTACVWTGTGATLPAAGYPSRTGCIRILRGKTKNIVKREYEIATELGKLMRAIAPAMRQGIVFKVLYYRYYNFDLDQPFQPQYEQNNRHLLADLHRIAGEQ